jgi:major type 1 subunit fimbrin (pilin)
MKLKLLSAVALAALTMVSQQASAADGTITFTGLIKSPTCTINGGVPAAASFTVTLPTVGTTALTAAGKTAGTTPFSIDLTNCPAGSTPRAFFEPDAAKIDMTTGRLKNTGAATNVQVALLNDDLTPIDVSKTDGSQNSTSATLDAAGAGTLKYRAQYYATGAVAGGTVSASVVYTIVYP